MILSTSNRRVSLHFETCIALSGHSAGPAISPQTP
jgi:hypothetical protein